MIRIGILGAGAMGRVHAAAYAGMDTVDVTGIFSRNVEQARSAAAVCSAAPAASAEALFDDPRIDAIDVCLPSEQHPGAVIAALEHGKHVFCETPMALSLDAACRMRDAARRAGRLLQVGLLVRSIAPYRHVKAIAEAGTQGRLLGLSTWRLGSYLHVGSPAHKPHYGDPTTELMTFDVDFAGWAMGRPTRLSAAGTTEVTALLGYDDGRSATVTVSGLMPPGTPFTAGFRALFEKACFELHQVFTDGPPRTTFTIGQGGSPPRSIELEDGNPYELELRRFVACVDGHGDPALLDADRAIDALRLSIAARQALAERRTVSIE
jgi:UDP-N-acetylglucosamine 3-dehydrogenase